jgi:hypothetical protein
MLFITANRTAPTLVTLWLEYVWDMAECENMTDWFENRAEAEEWNASCRAMERAEGAYYDGYDPEAQADLAYPTYAELMGLDENCEASH